MVTRNYYFFHLFCPYVKHFKKKKQTTKKHQHEQTTYLASSWCQEISKNQQRMQSPIQKMSLCWCIAPVITTWKKKPLIARTSSIRQLNQCISEDFEEWNCLCPQAFVANLFKTLTVSLPWRILGNKQRDKGTVFAPLLSFKTSQCNPYQFQSLDGGLTHAMSSVKDGKEFFSVVVHKSITKNYPVAECD